MNTAQQKPNAPSCSSNATVQPNEHHSGKHLSCFRCRNHGVTATLKGHKRSCEFKNCQCDICKLVVQIQRSKAAHIAFRRQRQMEKTQANIPNNGVMGSVNAGNSQQFNEHAAMATASIPKRKADELNTEDDNDIEDFSSLSNPMESEDHLEDVIDKPSLRSSPQNDEITVEEDFRTNRDLFASKIQNLMGELKCRGFVLSDNLLTKCLLATILNLNKGNVARSANEISKSLFLFVK